MHAMQARPTTAFLEIAARRSRPWVNEAEVRLAWIGALEKALHIHFDAERAYKDGSYNNVIIEFKGPGLFKASKTSAKFKEATEQRLLPYIEREAIAAGIPTEDYIGIAIDGEHVCFAQVRAGVIYTQHLLPFSEYSVNLVVEAIRADKRRAITLENLVADFGHGSLNARTLMQVMADGLAAELGLAGNSKIKMLFEEWRALYGQVADMSVLQAEAINKEIGFFWRGSEQAAIPGRLFVIHSYNSLLIKLLAAEIVSAHGLTTTLQPAQAMAAVLNDEILLQTLAHDIEQGAIFSQAGINGFVEEVIFSWYLDIAQNPNYANVIIPALRGLLSALSLYRTDRLAHTRDVLRDLYQRLVPGKLRQSLGEFYTPDWLVDFTLAKLANESWLDKRFLDPTCGSGAFLVAVIRRMQHEALAAGWDAAQIVKHLCQAMWGFDLNPLAVQTARVNFLMEIAQLLQAAAGQRLEIPVLLADAIYSPASNPELGVEIMRYQIGSQVAGLQIELPAALVFNRHHLDQVFARMGEDVENDLDYDTVQARLLAARLLSTEQAAQWRAPLQYTYNQILTLHRQQWNGIWFRVVRNFFWSATAGQFDCIVGNPPWVRWSKLPDAYRERVKPTCENYGIFSKTKRHGGNELDISAMITYTSADKWLKVNGRIAFVLTGTLFKNPSSAGFRNFQLTPAKPDTLHLTPISVDDMKGLKTFEDASNHTVVAVLDKTVTPGTYPVPYRLWQKVEGFAKAIPADLPLTDVLQRLQMSAKEATPVNAAESGSPWAVLQPGRYAVLRQLAGEASGISGRKGITVDLNGIYFVPILQYNAQLLQIRSRPEAGKSAIGPSKTAWIEPQLVYPLLKGAADFEACYLRLAHPAYQKEILYTLLPNSGIDKASYQACEAALQRSELSHSKAWFLGYKQLLLERSTYRRQMQGAPYCAIYNVGDYTFKPWKVVWPEMCSHFYAAVVGSAEVPLMGTRPYVPDHKIYYVGFEHKMPAYFLCGLLNAPMVTEWIESHIISLQIGNIFKHTNVPTFDASNAQHQQLALWVEAAHQQHLAAKRAELLLQIRQLAETILQRWVC